MRQSYSVLRLATDSSDKSRADDARLYSASRLRRLLLLIFESIEQGFLKKHLFGLDLTLFNDDPLLARSCHFADERLVLHALPQKHFSIIDAGLAA